MSRICFVSYEIHPTTWGGCGVLLHNAAHVLLRQGHTVIFLLDIPTPDFTRFCEVDRLAFPAPECCLAYQVEKMCADLPFSRDKFGSDFLWRAYRFHWATQKVVTLEKPDIVEFFEYNGVAHYALAAKLTQSVYQDTHLTVRLHNSDQLINLHQPTTLLTMDYYLLYALEHNALKLAETVLYPSPTYLNEAYRPHYELWLGEVVHSKPPLVNHPKPSRNDQTSKYKILFYGRLFGFKGVDLFVDAAVKLLNEGQLEDLCFVLVGYDPHKAPDGSDKYQTYLLKRIPQRYQAQFEFTGQLNWRQLEELLPQVYCAVFPNYFESFCYAAHELYAAGIPLIVNNIPAFRDYFKDRENALLFDGTVADLTQQIEMLWQDKALREKIKRPYSLTGDPLGHFYEGPFSATWICSNDKIKSLPSVLICILEDIPLSADQTLRSIGPVNGSNIRIVILRAHQSDTEAGSLWFLGKLYSAVDAKGEVISATELETAETLLILRAGDLVHKDYIDSCLKVLARQPEISFVGCWKRIHQDNRVYLDTFPIDAALELVPFGHSSLFSRVVMRTIPGKLLIDLFDPRLMQMGEIGYLWDLEVAGKSGIVIPECLIEQNEDTIPTGNETLLAYLLARDSSKDRKTRLANYLLTTRSVQDPSTVSASQTRFSEEVAALVRTIGNWRIGRVIGQNSIMVKVGKFSLRWFRQRVQSQR